MTTSRQSDKRDKKAFLIGIVLISCVGVYFLSRNLFWTNSDSTAQTSADSAIDNKKEGNPSIAPDVLLKKIQNGDKMAIVDIRDETAFDSEHIAHSFLVPIGSLQNFSPDKEESVVIAFSEADTQMFETAKNILAQKSFPYFFLEGGIEAWKGRSMPLISGGDPNSFIDQSKVTYIGLEAFKKLSIEKKSLLFVLDVQSAENYKKKHLAGVANIPLTELENRASEIPAGRQIVVYGENDAVSFRGGVRIFDLGIFTAQTLSGNKYLSPDSGLLFEP